MEYFDVVVSKDKQILGLKLLHSMRITLQRENLRAVSSLLADTIDSKEEHAPL